MNTVDYAGDCAKRFSTSTRIRLCCKKDGNELGLRFEKGGKAEFMKQLFRVMATKRYRYNNKRTITIPYKFDPNNVEQTATSSTGSDSNDSTPVNSDIKVFSFLDSDTVR